MLFRITHILANNKEISKQNKTLTQGSSGLSWGTGSHRQFTSISKAYSAGGHTGTSLMRRRMCILHITFIYLYHIFYSLNENIMWQKEKYIKIPFTYICKVQKTRVYFVLNIHT